MQERYPSVSGFTSIADNCFQVISSGHTSRGYNWQVLAAAVQRCICPAWSIQAHCWPLLIPVPDLQMKDLVRMEGLVLQSLDFRVNAPTCFTFYSVLLRHLQPSPKTAALASYILVHPSQQNPVLPAC